MNFATRMETAVGLTCNAAEYLALENIKGLAFNVVRRDIIQDMASGLRDPALLPGAVEVAEESAHWKQQMESAALTPQMFDRMARRGAQRILRQYAGGGFTLVLRAVLAEYDG